MIDERCFVQFLHPGSEHRPDGPGFKSWNSTRHAHGRKFMTTRGRYLTGTRVIDGEILLWGEWEPESEVVAVIDKRVEEGPRYIYRPYYSTPTTFRNLQNTDPFVFGGFRYTGCQQYRKTGPTQLRNLEKGSVVLFGSNRHGRFTLDTVFVVADWIDHDARCDEDVLSGQVPAAYRDVTLSPWYGSSEGAGQSERSHRLYRGATFDRRVLGMYSFFPCAPFSPGTSGFARPAIELDGVLNPTMRQGFKVTRYISPTEVRTYWARVAEQVQQRGLCLGFEAEIPTLRVTSPKPA